MPRFIKGSPEAIAFGQKMKEAREKKKAERESQKPSIAEKGEEYIGEIVSTKPEEKTEETKQEPEVVVHTDTGTQSTMTEFLQNIVWEYFPDKEVKVRERDDRKCEITIVIGEIRKEVLVPKGPEPTRTTVEPDIRSFVVDKVIAEAQTKQWCQKIKDKLEGKTTTPGITGFTTNKKLPPSLGPDAQFFFRE